MAFKATFCDPLQPDIIDLDYVDDKDILNKFKQIHWDHYLQSMEDKKDSEIFYSPSYEIENQGNKNGLTISAIGKPGNFEFSIFFKRPKKVKTLFGLSEKVKDDYLTEIHGRTMNDVLLYLDALQKDNLALLEDKIK